MAIPGAPSTAWGFTTEPRDSRCSSRSGWARAWPDLARSQMKNALTGMAGRDGWPGKETLVSDMTLKYPLWQNHYLQAMAETRPELLKSKISAAEQVVSLRLRQLANTTDDYEEQIALAAALKSLKFLTAPWLTQRIIR